MTVIRPNSISGVTSITALQNSIEFYKSDGSLSGANINGISINTAGIITANTFYGNGANLTGINADLVNDSSPQLGGTLDANGNNIHLGDNGRLRCGASQDLDIYHSTHSYIENDTGHLYIRNHESNSQSTFLTLKESQEFGIFKYGTSEWLFKGAVGGSTEMWYDGSKKIETTSSGVTITGNLTSDGLLMSDSEEIQLGNSTDVRIFHDSNNTFFKNLTGDLILNSSSIYLNNAAQSATMLKATQAADVSLYFNGTQEFRTTSYGISIGENTAGSISGQAGIEIGKGHTTSELRLKNSSGGSGSGDGFGIQKWSDGNTYIYEYDPHNFVIGTNGASRWIIGGTSGHITPASNNTYDIGSATARVRNIYTGDLHLSNEPKKDKGGNDVDGTWGDYTIQEGESDLFLINKRSGKKFKFMLQEVS